MKKSIRSIISIITILSLAGCTTATIRTTDIIDSRNIGKQKVFIDNFRAVKSERALFVQGRIINKSGFELTNIQLEARGYDKNYQLISTDKIELVPNRLKNREKISFSMTFTKNVGKIDSYYFVGKYDSVKTELKVDWDTLGVVLLAAGTIVAIAAAAYYEQGQSMYNAPSTNYIPQIYQSHTSSIIVPQISQPYVSSTQSSGCVWKWDCSISPCQQVPLCNNALDMVPIKPVSMAPIALPSIKPMKLPSIPPIGTSRCDQRYICDNNSCAWQEVCQ